MSSPKATPIIIGVGDIKNRSQKVEDAIEPLHLMLRAIEQALNDTDASSKHDLQSQIDSIDVVRTWTWPYPDIAASIAEHIGAEKVGRVFCSDHGGDKPAKLVDEAARRISKRECEIAVVTGGEALASLAACVAAKTMPPPGWTKPDQNVESVFSPTSRELAKTLGGRHSIGAPIHIYPLYENGFRSHWGQSIEENNSESAELYAEFAKVAEQNSMAWNHGKPAETADSIGTVSKRNRMICYPYPLLMNAFNTVNLAAAVILTSTVRAEALGIPKHKWIYPLGGAGTAESSEFWNRMNFYSSPAICASLDKGLAAAALSKDDIDLYDFYSCFPIVPKLACKHLGLPVVSKGKREKPITLLGGLTSFGGAGNNYSMHAITEMVRQLRSGNNGQQNGLILANGGTLTYQHVLCLSSQAPAKAYSSSNPLPAQLPAEPPIPVAEHAEGEAVIETYTVEFARDGEPLRGYIVGRLLGDGKRFVANHGDRNTLNRLCSRELEPVGSKGFAWESPSQETIVT
ncbi:hypothetical protein K490DRAFT_75612 [Saccharata proteae CBS 121410]|uniref:Thiolase-like protein type 1 additional C-terminal domain-containing protein n=1 Tax=Saccharata proteae CBS 121410 TaxID=1314787 RepID=A0A9P4HQJ8_9PEZI|nr:hypothetical protein K490DRAFT_75612 [Saccharata proteae CBS 121410]